MEEENISMNKKDNSFHHSSHNERVFNKSIDRLRNPERVERLEIKRVVDLSINIGDIKSVLDIGTGSGLFAEEFHKRGLKVSGIDLNPNMIESAKKYIPEGEFRLAPAEKIPFEDNFFDVSFFGVVFHEVDDYLIAMKEAFRVSRLGTSILEWNYSEESFGPPLKHRLKSEFIQNLAEKAGYKNFESVKLNSLVLYLLKK